ncbi:MAG TPA: isoaspartyl peptidase/L-asparaginase [Nitrososphaerales archaeon]|nr:isoaspartyl peptidase/L-asparaginase [Nitrososphaerales archaeon]
MNPAPTVMVHGGAGGGKYPKGDKRFGELRKAVELGMEALRSGSSVDAVVAAVSHMEDSGAFNSGRGACLTSEGRMELDAAVMSGNGYSGAGVGVVTCTHSPVKLARWVMENTRHVLIVGESCKDYARRANIRVEALAPSEAAEEKYVMLSRATGQSAAAKIDPTKGNTVGAVALDKEGVPAAAVSTGGTWMKLPGRVGDSAILGAGVYADRRAGASCATGTGEEIIRLALSIRACDYMKGSTAQGAARKAVALMTKERGPGTAGIITVDARGGVGAACNTAAMGRAWFDHAKGRTVVRI